MGRAGRRGWPAGLEATPKTAAAERPLRSPGCVLLSLVQWADAMMSAVSLAIVQRTFASCTSINDALCSKAFCEH